MKETIKKNKKIFIKMSDDYQSPRLDSKHNIVNKVEVAIRIKHGNEGGQSMNSNFGKNSLTEYSNIFVSDQVITFNSIYKSIYLY